MGVEKLWMNKEMQPDQDPNYSGYLVIGAGLPRTGTMSTFTALGDLLKARCYHMAHVAIGGAPELEFWERALNNDLKRDDWVQFLQGRGYAAGVDYPISLFYKELMDVFPNAKVLLTVRDPVKWYESVKNTIDYGQSIAKDSLLPNAFLRLTGAGKLVDVTSRVAHEKPPGFKHSMIEAVRDGQNSAVEFFNQWTAYVKATVPKGRLLVFEVKEGWDPLCKFLDLPVPETPFPRVNDTAKMRRSINIVWYLGHAFFLIPLAVSMAVAYKYFF